MTFDVPEAGLGTLEPGATTVGHAQDTGTTVAALCLKWKDCHTSMIQNTKPNPWASTDKHRTHTI